MSKYEISLSPNYLSDWTIIDAIRELFQNARDQQEVDPSNTMFFNYNKDTETLTIGNKLSILEARTLLMGTSTKRDDANLIGQHGEGYKVATLVLLRSGKTITFYNYGSKEVWKPRFVKSRKYQGEQLLTFFVETKAFWEKIPDNNLTIEVTGITSEDYEEIQNHNLYCQDEPLKALPTSEGDILLEDKFAGAVFVGGLFVCDYPQYRYGYNFKPGRLKLDRDRKLASDFDLKWLSSSMWKDCQNDLVLELVKDNAADVAFIKSRYNWYATTSKDAELYDKACTTFKETYGTNAIPVTTQYELEQATNELKDAVPVIVNENYQYMIKKSKQYTEPEFKVTYSTQDKLYAWSATIQHLIPNNKLVEFYDLIRNL